MSKLFLIDVIKMCQIGKLVTTITDNTNSNFKVQNYKEIKQKKYPPKKRKRARKECPADAFSPGFGGSHGLLFVSAANQGCPLPYKVSEDEDSAPRPKRDRDSDEEDDREPLEQARERLLSLEKNIERRYLKPPLAKG